MLWYIQHMSLYGAWRLVEAERYREDVSVKRSQLEAEVVEAGGSRGGAWGSLEEPGGTWGAWGNLGS